MLFPPRLKVIELVVVLAAILTPASTAAQLPTFITAWGSFGTGPLQFRTPVGVGVDAAGNVYVCDSNNNRVQQFSNNGAFITEWGTLGSGNGQLYHPWGLAVDPSGIVYVADTENSRIQKFNSGGSYLMQWGTRGTGAGQFEGVGGVAVDPAGNVFTLEKGQRRVQKFTSSGGFLTQWGHPGAGVGYYSPDGIAVDAWGNVYVADNYGSQVVKFSNEGALLGYWGTDLLDYPVRLAADAEFVYVVDYQRNAVVVFRTDGSFVTRWGDAGGGPGEFRNPTGIAVDASRNIFVCDTNNSRMQKFSFLTTPAHAVSWGGIKARYRQGIGQTGGAGSSSAGSR